MVSVGVNFGLDLAQEITALKRERNAVILAHNYQIPEIQDVADFVGDSLGLSFEAAKTDAEVILFCGVHFMAETAKILNPTKKVILPDLDAGCSLSESCPPEKLAQFLAQHADKNYYVIAYINCSAGVKALSDVICTSGNAEKIVRAAPADRNILFVPDQNLGAWVIEHTGRPMDLWQGNCYVHVEFTAPQHRRASTPSIRARRSSPIPSAPTPSACSPTRFVRRKKWSPTAGNRPPRKSSSSPKPACCTGCKKKCPARPSSRARPIVAPAPSAGS